MLLAKRFIFTVLIFVATFAAGNSHAQFVLVDEGSLFVDQSILERTIGIEIEFSGIPDDVVTNLILQHFGGKIDSGDVASDLLIASSIGQIKLKIEGRAWRFEDDPVRFQQARLDDIKNAPREVVFPPVRYMQNDFYHRLENFVRDLKYHGALGTEASRAVSFQVNVQMGDLNAGQENVDDLVNLMRVYLRPEHREQIDALLGVPAIRAEFLNDYSPGFMTRLLNPLYRPTAREFYDDFFYRQSLELLGSATAWTAPIESVRSDLLAKGEDQAVISRVVKMTKLRVSSLLLMAFPDDQLSKWIVNSKWARPAPIVEFREFNNTFEADFYIEMVLGTVRATQLFGNYNHDILMSGLTKIDVESFVEMRRQFQQSSKKRFVDFRNLMDGRPTECQKLFLKINGAAP